MTAHDDITRTSPVRMGKGLLFVFIPMIITLYLSITLWHFTSSFPPMVAVPKTTPNSAVAGSPHVGSATQKPGTLTIPAGASVQGNPSYIPADLVVKKGDVVTVTNTDSAPHTVTNGASATDPQNGKSFDTSLIMPGKTAKINTRDSDAAGACARHFRQSVPVPGLRQDSHRHDAWR
jgi:plastocyanin